MQEITSKKKNDILIYRWLFVFLADQTQIAANSSRIIQDSGIILTAVRETVTLNCSCDSDTVTFYSWYQQKLGGKPLVIATRMRQGQANLNDEYRARFNVTSGKGINHLTISGLLQSDSAMYYCGILEFNAIEFGKGVFLHVRTSLPSNSLAVYQPELVQLPLGQTLNLSCYTNPKECKEEHNMFWFKHSAGKVTIMYQNVGHCMSELKSGTRNCTSHFSIKSVTSSDAGKYYCAMALSGELVFGNGTLVKLTGWWLSHFAFN